jgi:NAD(P)-dependent dehydrogenase (short-subunit alcohol dehydrogenase family)
MGALDGRVAIITGAGRGLGREHALLFAREGARVVVNDLGVAADGSGSDLAPAQQVVEEIRAMGGEAFASTDDVADWDGARRLIRSAVDAFGELHILVNNAGILRDRTLPNMSAEEWDAVIRVNLRGTFCMTRFAAEYWRDQAKAGKELRPAVVSTTSWTGLIGNFGQSNYAAAKGGIAAFTTVAQMELDRFGVRCNAIAPTGRTRLTADTGNAADAKKIPDDPDTFDVWHPGNVAPLAAYLCQADCPIKGRVFFINGGDIYPMQPWTFLEPIRKSHRWTIAELEESLPAALGPLPAPPRIA